MTYRDIKDEENRYRYDQATTAATCATGRNNKVPADQWNTKRKDFAPQKM